MVLRGLCGILFGVVAVLEPRIAILSLISVFAVYLLADGVFGLISAAIAGQRGERWSLLVAESLFNVAIGVVMLLFPTVTIYTFMLVIAAWAILTGALAIGTAMNHRRAGRWPLVIGGLVSVVFGIVLAIGPLIGAVVLTWWLGISCPDLRRRAPGLRPRLRALTAEQRAGPLIRRAGSRPEPARCRST